MAEPITPEAMDRRCWTCKNAGEWHTEATRHGTKTAATCMVDPLPEFWRVIGDRPVVGPHHGTNCNMYSPKETP